MKYMSTRGRVEAVNGAEAIIQGLASDGGLYVPTNIPVVSSQELEELIKLSYQDRAVSILSKFLSTFSKAELTESVKAAYDINKFGSDKIAPIRSISKNVHVLELWHGPTCAFKDMALQLLPQLLSKALKKQNISQEVVILVATSGDTGKAALEGFKDVDQTRIIVFYPQEGVSEIQRLQMVTQEGNNVSVVAVQGNFDDAQSGVKEIFNDQKLSDNLAARNFQFSSANSINWGRLVPQIVYYFSAYADLVDEGKIELGQSVNFVVPTGNFGNILAGYYAKCMGLPINRLICASNANNVLTEFIKTGVYNRKRKFHKTISPSMDILISSNLERLLYHITNEDTHLVDGLMTKLGEEGCYRISDEMHRKIADIFWADFAEDEQTLDSIKAIYSEYAYLADPHTAVAWDVYKEYQRQTQDETTTCIVSTASPFKFNTSVMKAVTGKDAAAFASDFAALHELSNSTRWPIPSSMLELETKKIRHKDVCLKNQMKQVVLDKLEG